MVSFDEYLKCLSILPEIATSPELLTFLGLLNRTQETHEIGIYIVSLFVDLVVFVS